MVPPAFRIRLGARIIVSVGSFSLLLDRFNGWMKQRARRQELMRVRRLMLRAERRLRA